MDTRNAKIFIGLIALVIVTVLGLSLVNCGNIGKVRELRRWSNNCNGGALTLSNLVPNPMLLHTGTNTVSVEFDVAGAKCQNLHYDATLDFPTYSIGITGSATAPTDAFTNAMDMTFNVGSTAATGTLSIVVSSATETSNTLIGRVVIQ